MEDEKIKPGIIYYFGCWNQAGHDLHSPSERRGPGSLSIYDLPRPLYPGIDFSYCSKDRTEGSYFYTEDEIGWSIISIWDNSVDSRPGSHATFLTTPVMSHDELLTAAKETWPKIFERMKATLVRKNERKPLKDY